MTPQCFSFLGLQQTNGLSKAGWIAGCTPLDKLPEQEDKEQERILQLESMKGSLFLPLNLCCCIHLIYCLCKPLATWPSQSLNAVVSDDTTLGAFQFQSLLIRRIFDPTHPADWLNRISRYYSLERAAPQRTIFTIIPLNSIGRYPMSIN